MNTKALRQQNSLLALNRYVSDRDNQIRQVGSNPSMITMMSDRDKARGVYNLVAANGGNTTGKTITSAGLPTGATVPLTLATGAGNRVDARPVL